MKHRINPFSFIAPAPRLNVKAMTAATEEKDMGTDTEILTASKIIARQEQAFASLRERLRKTCELDCAGYDFGELRKDIDELLTEEEWTPSQSDYGPTT